MKYYALFIIVFVFSATAFAQRYTTSFGGVADFSASKGGAFAAGPALKHFFNSKNAVEIETVFNGGLFINLLYQYHVPLDKQSNMQWFVGGGGSVGIGSSSVVFARPVTGFEYSFPQTKWTISADWRPIIHFYSDNDLSHFRANNFGVGIKYILR